MHLPKKESVALSCEKSYKNLSAVASVLRQELINECASVSPGLGAHTALENISLASQELDIIWRLLLDAIHDESRIAVLGYKLFVSDAVIKECKQIVQRMHEPKSEKAKKDIENLLTFAPGLERIISLLSSLKMAMLSGKCGWTSACDEHLLATHHHLSMLFCWNYGIQCTVWQKEGTEMTRDEYEKFVSSDYVVTNKVFGLIVKLFLLLLPAISENSICSQHDTPLPAKPDDQHKNEQLADEKAERYEPK